MSTPPTLGTTKTMMVHLPLKKVRVKAIPGEIKKKIGDTNNFKICIERTSGRRRLQTRSPWEKQWNIIAIIFPGCLHNGFAISPRTLQELLWFFPSFVACLNNNMAAYCRNQTCLCSTSLSKKYFCQLGWSWQNNHQLWDAPIATEQSDLLQNRAFM